MSLFSFVMKPVYWAARQVAGMVKGTAATDKVAAVAQPAFDAFLDTQKAQITAAIDAEAAQLKAQKVASAAQVRDRIVAVAQQKAQQIGVSNGYVRALTVSLDALVFPSVNGVYANSDAAIDYVATRAKAIVEAL